MRIDILTLFPEMFAAPLRAGLLGRAIERGILEVVVTNIRDFATDHYRTVDDAPFGGGAGMVMKCEPVFGAVADLRGKNSLERIILLSPRGRTLNQARVCELAQVPDAVLICGRYEGVDERVSVGLCTEEISIGDYVLSGGELPALVLVEAVSRMLPGVVGKWDSVVTDSFYDGILGPPQYTRPAVFQGMEVPSVLRNGNHADIERWRRKEALRVTLTRRPELLTGCSKEDIRLLAELSHCPPEPGEGKAREEG
jgi:tRNA (guanine37-N1)-methyltransferase